ncbi:LysR family transcriptional regulator, partial [Acinetobacter baumannii]
GGLTLRHIESYNLVSATGSTLAAAARLGMSQSSVSRMLAQLETYLGIRLFERDKNRLVPTREGLHLGPRIRAIADQLEAVRHSAAELRTGNSQDVL